MTAARTGVVHKPAGLTAASRATDPVAHTPAGWTEDRRAGQKATDRTASPKMAARTVAAHMATGHSRLAAARPWGRQAGTPAVAATLENSTPDLDSAGFRSSGAVSGDSVEGLRTLPRRTDNSRPLHVLSLGATAGSHGDHKPLCSAVPTKAGLKPQMMLAQCMECHRRGMNAMCGTSGSGGHPRNVGNASSGGTFPMPAKAATNSARWAMGPLWTARRRSSCRWPGSRRLLRGTTPAARSAAGRRLSLT